MSQLTVKDYENIFNFYVFINKDYSDFINRTLTALSDFFDFKLTAYAVFDVNSDGQRSISNIESLYLRPNLLKHYKENYFQYDTFYKKIDTLRYSNKTKYLYTSNDLCYEEFLNSPYGKLLMENGIAYQTILGGSDGAHPPIHIISIFKTGEEGNFTPRELELLSQIGKAYYESMKLYRKYIVQANKLFLTSHLTDLTSLGFVILTQNKSVVNSNELFVNYGSFLSNKSNLNEIVYDLIELVESTNQISIDKLKENATVKNNDFLITIYPPQIRQNENIETYHFLTISKIIQNRQGDDIQNLLVEEYNLTSREGEIIRLLVDGASNLQISESLYISVSTVKSHVRNVFNKLNVSTRSEAIRKIRKMTDVRQSNQNSQQ